MNLKLKSRSLLAAAVALSLALPGMASAERRGHDNHDYGTNYSHGYKQNHRQQNRDRHQEYRGHRDQRQEYRGHRDPQPEHRGHGDRYITRYYKDDDDGEKLLIGLVVGGILGYAINGAQHSNAYDYNNR